MELYLKAKKLASKLAQQIIDGIEPNGYLETYDKYEETVRLLSDPVQRTALLNKFSQNEKQKAIQSLRIYIRQKKHRQTLRRYIKMAAILVLVIGIAIAYYANQQEDQQLYIANNPLSPGKPQATLILASGKEIKLNSELSLKEKNTDILNKKSGEIIYTSTSEEVETEQHDQSTPLRRIFDYIIRRDSNKIEFRKRITLPDSFLRRKTRSVPEGRSLSGSI